MKTLYIVRHAKASQNITGLKDWERPLMSMGIERANKISGILKKKKTYPDKIISSHAFRAINTAIIFAKNLEYPVNNIEITTGFYGNNSSDIIDIISEQSNEISSLMVFGHNPVWTELYNILSEEKLAHLSTSAVCYIQFEMDDWNKILTKKGKSVFVETGK